MQSTLATQILGSVAKELAKEQATMLAELKRSYDEINRPDFLWHFLLQSFATMGRSTGWQGLIGNKSNYTRVTFEALDALPKEEMEKVVVEVCHAAKVRMPDRKAEFILGCFHAIKAMGGPKSAKVQLLSQSGRDAKIQWLMKLPGIGPKYARNIMMDVYHEDFRNSIAVDVRLKSITDLLGLSFENYEDHERFFLDSAELAGINGWELDRLIYNFKSDFEQKIVAQLNQN